MQLEMKSKIRYLEISLYVISMIEYLQAELSISFYTYFCRMQNMCFNSMILLRLIMEHNFVTITFLYLLICDFLGTWTTYQI